MQRKGRAFRPHPAQLPPVRGTRGPRSVARSNLRESGLRQQGYESLIPKIRRSLVRSTAGFLDIWCCGQHSYAPSPTPLSVARVRYRVPATSVPLKSGRLHDGSVLYSEEMGSNRWPQAGSNASARHDLPSVEGGVPQQHHGDLDRAEGSRPARDRCHRHFHQDRRARDRCDRP